MILEDQRVSIQTRRADDVLTQLFQIAESQGMAEAVYWHSQALFSQRPQDLELHQLEVLVDRFMPAVIFLMMEKDGARTIQ